MHNRPRASMRGAGRSCLFSPREKIEMRGTLATTKGHRSRSTPLRKPLSPWERLREGTRRQARRARRALPAGLLSPCRPLHNRPRASMGGAGRSCLFSPREKIEMRDTLATTKGHRSRSTPLRKPLSPWERLREGTRRQARRARRALPAGLLSPCRPLHNRPRASMGGAGRSCLFSPREKIEMRGTLATTKGHRSRSTPLRKPLSPWERLREGTRRQARRARRALPAGLLSPCRPLHNRPRASMGGVGRSCLFSRWRPLRNRDVVVVVTRGPVRGHEGGVVCGLGGLRSPLRGPIGPSAGPILAPPGC